LSSEPGFIVIGGPTACGKTAVAAALAEMIGGEVISADSMQIYKLMDIGTGKPTPEETRGVPHHLISELFPDEQYSAAVFTDMAKSRADDIVSRGKTPIVAGGTGFYINALICGTEFAVGGDGALRAELAATAEKLGHEYLHDMLARRDPDAAAAIHPHNVKRVIRALEYCEKSGGLFSVYNADQRRSRAVGHGHTVFILTAERARLYGRINSRAEGMVERGLANEVRGLLDAGYGKGLVSMQGLGYKEMVRHIEGRATLDEALDDIKIRTRRFAKRQITWFSRQTDGEWIDADDFGGTDDAAEYIASRVKKRARLLRAGQRGEERFFDE
jgi:tRNA dimethylallyltransferase